MLIAVGFVTVDSRWLFPAWGLCVRLFVVVRFVLCVCVCGWYLVSCLFICFVFVCVWSFCLGLLLVVSCCFALFVLIVFSCCLLLELCLRCWCCGLVDVWWWLPVSVRFGLILWLYLLLLRVRYFVFVLFVFIVLRCLLLLVACLLFVMFGLCCLSGF